jgi:hypothetical protein
MDCDLMNRGLFMMSGGQILMTRFQKTCGSHDIPMRGDAYVGIGTRILAKPPGPIKGHQDMNLRRHTMSFPLLKECSCCYIDKTRV